MCLLLILCAITASDEFTCDKSSLAQALPRLKVVMSEASYNKLAKLNRKLNQEAQARRQAPDNVALGKMIADCVSDDRQRLLCYAAIRIKNGYISITDQCIGKYLSLDSNTVAKLREHNTKLLIEMTTLVGEMKYPVDNDQCVKIREASIAKYKTSSVILKAVLTSQQIRLLDIIYAECNHDISVLAIVSRLNNTRAVQLEKNAGYKTAHHNIQFYMPSDMLIVMDQKPARDYLQLSPEQDIDVQSLYTQYLETVTKLQLSLSDSLTRTGDESYRAFQNQAYKYDSEYTARFHNIMNPSQKTRILQLTAQVVGYKFSFSVPFLQQLGVTTQQNKNQLRYLSKKTFEYPESLDGSNFDYEKLYRFEVFISECVRDEVLTQEHRD